MVEVCSIQNRRSNWSLRTKWNEWMRYVRISLLDTSLKTSFFLSFFSVSCLTYFLLLNIIELQRLLSVLAYWDLALGWVLVLFLWNDFLLQPNVFLYIGFAFAFATEKNMVYQFCLRDMSGLLFFCICFLLCHLSVLSLIVSLSW